MCRAQIRRAARSFAISSKKSLWMSQKKERRAAKLSMSSPRATPRSTYVKPEENCRRPIDGHRGGDLVERNPVEQRFHVSQGRDRDATLADLSFGARMIGVVAHQGREIECDGETGLTMLEQKFVTAVGVRGAAESGELPHRPEPAAVHRGMNPARERVLPRFSKLPLDVKPVQVRGRVQRFLFDH